jgi:2-amino-4-hydroxy-6-hydroxymethyldihydropteridine diphosphokinase
VENRPGNNLTNANFALALNLRDRSSNLNMAIAKFPPEIQLIQASTLYPSPPWGLLDQPDFHNQVVSENTLPPDAIRSTTKNYEILIGCQSTFANGPKLIDLDILFYTDYALSTFRLQTPHPHLQERAFALVPLCDMVSTFCHPILRKTAQDLPQEIPSGVFRSLSEIPAC